MNELLEYKGYYGTVEFSVADNVHFGKVMGIRGLISYEGDNVQSLKQDFEEAVDDYLETCKEEDVEPEKPYIGSFNVKLPPEFYKTLAFYSASNEKSFDSTVEEAIRYFFEIKFKNIN